MKTEDDAVSTVAELAQAIESFQAALDGMSEEEVNERWQAEMVPFFENIGGHADEMMEELIEVFHLD